MRTGADGIKRKKQNRSLPWGNKHYLLWDVIAVERMRGLPYLLTWAMEGVTALLLLLGFSYLLKILLVTFPDLLNSRKSPRLKNYQDKLFLFFCCGAVSKGRNLFLDALFFFDGWPFCEAWVHQRRVSHQPDVWAGAHGQQSPHLPEIRWHTGTRNRYTGSARAPATPDR